MSFEPLIALSVFALVTSVTPGPNNLMLMASGANFGFRRTIPHMLGIGIGFTVMIILVGLGISRMFEVWPVAHRILAGLSAAYLLWLAWKIAHAAAPGTGETTGQPMTFLAAAAFQWVNPKAWAMALSAVTVYSPGTGLWAIVLVALIFGSINLPSVSIWTVLGQGVRQLLTNPARLRVFNWTMALLLVVSMVPVLIDWV